MLPMLVWLAAAGLSSPMPAPQNAVLTGSVVERSGGAIPGVSVIVESAPSTIVARAVTDRSGTYRIELVAGTYTVRFELAGFETYVRRQLLTAGQTRSLTVALDVGRLAIVDHITGAAPAPDPTFPVQDGEVAVGVRTSLGTFYLAVDTRRAPITAANFLKYVDAGLYEWGRFHRATRPDNYTPAPPDRPMMNIIQGGINPDRWQEGFPPIPLERTSVTGIRHVTGVVSMARGTAADTATSDFFVLLDDQPSLDFGGRRFEDGQGGGAFGRVLSGLNVVRRIQQQPVDGQNLSAPVVIHRVWRLRPAER